MMIGTTPQPAIYMGVFLLSVMLSAASNAGLIGYYTFEGNANDVSGNGNNGVLSPAAPAVTANGFQGSAYQFGTGGANTFVTVPIDINPTVLPRVTFGAWVNADVNDEVIRGIISHDTGNFDRTLDVDTRGPTIGAVDWCMFLGPTSQGTCGGAVGVDTWTFLVARYDANLNIARFTVNGTNFGDFVANPGEGETVTTIGRNPNFDFPFVGRIDNVFFYDDFLSDEQVNDIFRNGVKVPEPLTPALIALGLAGLVYQRRKKIITG